MLFSLSAFTAGVPSGRPLRDPSEVTYTHPSAMSSQEEIMKRYLETLHRQWKAMIRMLQAMSANPLVFVQAMNAVPSICGAYRFSRDYIDTAPAPDAIDSVSSSSNPLWEYFQNRKEGPGIWKWEHYFEVYHRHFAKFVGRNVNVLEIGIYSGGSLEMWWSYFGGGAHVYGVDIEETCRQYANDHISVFIGDQADRVFWNTFKASVEGIDILIDDGGHTPEQQQTTLEEMLPHLRPGGVYLCEDVHSSNNRFSAFASGLVDQLNGVWVSGLPLVSSVSRFQSSIHSIHFYPYLVVIEKHQAPATKLSSHRRGSQWRPFL